jgi:hypothetical protein
VRAGGSHPRRSNRRCGHLVFEEPDSGQLGAGKRSVSTVPDRQSRRRYTNEAAHHADKQCPRPSSCIYNLVNRDCQGRVTWATSFGPGTRAIQQRRVELRPALLAIVCDVRRIGALGPLRSLDPPACYPERTVSVEPDVIAICFGWLLRRAIRRAEEPFRVRSEAKGNSNE